MFFYYYLVCLVFISVCCTVVFECVECGECVASARIGLLVCSFFCCFFSLCLVCTCGVD